jgi:TonB family protein
MTIEAAIVGTKKTVGTMERGSTFILAAFMTWLLMGGTFASSSAPTSLRVTPQRTALFEAERTLLRVPAHISEFTPVSEPLALAKCGHVRPPEALLTPDPLLPTEDDELLVRVSFIVGSDGHVHSAFVLTGARTDEDEAVLRAVRQWRYRPALCNGVPTDSEARVRFSIR